jgi:hypothetical protein
MNNIITRTMFVDVCVCAFPMRTLRWRKSASKKLAVVLKPFWHSTMGIFEMLAVRWHAAQSRWLAARRGGIIRTASGGGVPTFGSRSGIVSGKCAWVFLFPIFKPKNWWIFLSNRETFIVIIYMFSLYIDILYNFCYLFPLMKQENVK